MKAIRNGWRPVETEVQWAVLELLLFNQNENFGDLAWPSKETIASRLPVTRSERTVQRALDQLVNQMRLVSRFEIGRDLRLYKVVKSPGSADADSNGLVRVPTSDSVRNWGASWRPGNTHRYLPPVRRRFVPQMQGKALEVYVIEIPSDARVPVLPGYVGDPQAPPGARSQHDSPLETRMSLPVEPNLAQPGDTYAPRGESMLSPKVRTEQQQEIPYVNGEENGGDQASADQQSERTLDADAPGFPGSVNVGASGAKALIYELIDRDGFPTNDEAIAAFIDRCTEAGRFDRDKVARLFHVEKMRRTVGAPLRAAAG